MRIRTALVYTLIAALSVAVLVPSTGFAAGLIELQRPGGQRPGGTQAPGEQDIVPEKLEDWHELTEVIMTDAEKKEWKELLSDVPREEFIAAFWGTRDPTLGTEENEVRMIFMRRAGRAMRMAREQGMPGYATDRGKVLIVYGLPNEQETRRVGGNTGARGDSAGGGGGGDPVGGGGGGGGDPVGGGGGGGGGASAPPGGGGRPDIIWTYEHEPIAGQVRFSPVGRSSYSRRSRVDLTAERFNESIQGELQMMLRGGGGAGGAVTTAAGIRPMMGAPGGVPAVAPEVRIWMQMVQGGTMRSDFALQQRVQTFVAPDGTFTAFSFELGKEGLSFAETATGAQAQLKVFGALLQGEPGNEETVSQFDIPFTVGQEDGDDAETATRSFGVTLTPGTYRMAWGVLDESSEMAATSDEVIDIPDYTAPGLKLTSALLAVPPHRQQAEAMSTRAVYKGVRLGNILLADDVDRVFDRKDTVELVFIAMGWSPDPAVPGRPKLEIQYRILEGEEGEESLARLPTQTLGIHAVGQQIPLGQVSKLRAGGTYRIEIRVKDLVAGAEMVHYVPFKIAAILNEPS